MKSIVLFFALSLLCVMASSSQVDSNVFEGNRLKDINKDIVETIVVDQSGNGQFKTIQSAIDAIPSRNDHWIKIMIKKGIYNEKVMIPRDKRKIQMEGKKASETIIQHNEGGESVNGSTLRVYAEFFVAINITFKNTCNQYKNMTPYGEIQIAPAVVLAADKAAFFGCAFFSVQDTIGDLIGRHYFHQCDIKGAIDFIWGAGQSIYQSCTIEVLGVITLAEGKMENDKVDGGLIAGFITAQGRQNEKDTSGFVFNGCSIFGAGKAFLGRAYRGYSRVIFSNTNMDDVIVPQGWDAWSHQKQVDKITYVEVNCKGPGAKKKGRVEWEKNISTKDISYFTNRKTFLDKDGWIETLPSNQFYSQFSDSDESSIS